MGSLAVAIAYILGDLFAWKLGNYGVSWWIAITICFFVVYLFWNQIIAIIKKLLSLIGL